MRLNADGSLAFRLNCNSASGTWTAESGPDPSSGRFEFGPLAATMALCPPPSLDERVTRQAPYFRSYLLKDDRLYLRLMADVGIYVWARDGSTPAAGAVPAAPENGGPRNWEVTRTLKRREYQR